MKQNEEFFLVTHYADGKWQPDELVAGPPFQRVRQLLGGGWEHSKGILKDDMAMSAVRGDRRVLVLRFPSDFDRDRAERALAQILAGNEDTN